jgi:hypothetical protein
VADATAKAGILRRDSCQPFHTPEPDVSPASARGPAVRSAIQPTRGRAGNRVPYTGCGLIAGAFFRRFRESGNPRPVQGVGPFVLGSLFARIPYETVLARKASIANFG